MGSFRGEGERTIDVCPTLLSYVDGLETSERDGDRDMHVI